MLIDQENSDILSFRVILKRRFNHVRLRLYEVVHQHAALPDPVKREHTSIDDEEVLLLLVIDMTDPSEQQSRHRVL